MKIVNHPPKYIKIVQWFFPEYEFDKITAFTFADTIYTHYNPLADFHQIHEREHIRQMKGSRIIGIIHFLRYCFSKKFRYQSELEAYRKQYKYMKYMYPEQSQMALGSMAKTLSGRKIYGGLVDYETAYKDLLNI